MRIYFFLIALLLCHTLRAQEPGLKDLAPYDYDTVLKGGYSISFRTDDSFQYLYLQKGNRIITELSSTSLGLPYQNLGYIGADFKDYFVLVHSYGSGNPHYIELIRKETGQNIIKEGAAWIDADTAKNALLYCTNDVPTAKDKITLHFLPGGQRQQFPFPADILKEPQVLNRIQLYKLTDKQLILHYDTENGTKTKTYSR